MIKTYGKQYFIFDMDGVVTDSMSVWPRLILEMAEHFGAYLKDDYFDAIRAGSSLYTIQWIRDHYPVTATAEEMKLYFHDMAVEEFGTKVNLKPGVRKIMKDLKETGCTLVLYSNSPQRVINTVVERFELDEFLSYWISSEAIGNKTEIASYDKVIAHVGGIRAETVVLDDGITVPTMLKTYAPEIYRVAVSDPCYTAEKDNIKALTHDFLETFDDMYE